MNEEINDTEPRYVISVAASMLSVPTHTLRYYEKIGIIEPYRSRGNIRLYSENDIAVLRRVRSLVDDMGINLAGVEVVLRIMKQMNELMQEMEQMRAELEERRD